MLTNCTALAAKSIQTQHPHSRSAWHLAQESCITKRPLEISSRKKCVQGLCKKTMCFGAECRLVNGGVPKCIDENGKEFCPKGVPNIHDAVCGSDGKRYA